MFLSIYIFLMVKLYGLNLKNAIQSVAKEGISTLYRGVKPPLIQSMISKSMMFGMYNYIDDQLVQYSQLGSSRKHIAAFLAGTTEAVLSPFEVE